MGRCLLCQRITVLWWVGGDDHVHKLQCVCVCAGVAKPHAASLSQLKLVLCLSEQYHCQCATCRVMHACCFEPLAHGEFSSPSEHNARVPLGCTSSISRRAVGGCCTLLQATTTCTEASVGKLASSCTSQQHSRSTWWPSLLQSRSTFMRSSLYWDGCFCNKSWQTNFRRWISIVVLNSCQASSTGSCCDTVLGGGNSMHLASHCSAVSIQLNLVFV